MAFGVKVNKKHTRLIVGTKNIRSGTAHTVRISPHLKAMRPTAGLHNHLPVRQAIRKGRSTFGFHPQVEPRIRKKI